MENKKCHTVYNLYMFFIQEKLEDTKWVIRSCWSKKGRQYNGQNKKNKRTNNNLLTGQTQKTKDFSSFVLVYYHFVNIIVQEQLSHN